MSENSTEHVHEWITERDGTGPNGEPAYVSYCECGAYTPRHWKPRD